jgi:hypothetical protein
MHGRLKTLAQKANVWRVHVGKHLYKKHVYYHEQTMKNTCMKKLV